MKHVDTCSDCDRVATELGDWGWRGKGRVLERRKKRRRCLKEPKMFCIRGSLFLSLLAFREKESELRDTLCLIKKRKKGARGKRKRDRESEREREREGERERKKKRNSKTL